MLSVGHTVTTSVGMCDIDIRPVRAFVFPPEHIFKTEFSQITDLKI